MESREPKFMKEIHKIREELTKEWNRLSAEEILASLHTAGRGLKSQLSPPVGKTK